MTGRKAFSLLEVILALGILLGAIAVLGELARIGVRNAEIARDRSRAELLCEGIMAEIVSGAAPAEPVVGAPIELANEPGSPPWLYSVETQEIDPSGLMAVRVTVSQDLPPGVRPVEVSLARWMISPELEMAAQQAATEETTDLGL
jgi:general secretion pathway protein I